LKKEVLFGICKNCSWAERKKAMRKTIERHMWVISVILLLLLVVLVGFKNEVKIANQDAMRSFLQAVNSDGRGDANETIALYKAAIAPLTHAISVNQNSESDIALLNYRAMCYEATQDFIAAEADYNEALRLCQDTGPNAAWIRSSRCRFYLRRGVFDKSLADCNVLIDREPAKLYWRIIRGFVYAKMGNYELALADANEAITATKGTKDEAFYYRQRAEVRFYCNDVNGTMADLDKSLAIAKNSVGKCNSLLFKGKVLEQQCQPIAALKVYEQCLQEAGKLKLGDTASSLAMFGVVGTILNPFTPDMSYFKDEATRRIERIKSTQGKSN
jgi:tetratricopeptide (TPR) repeat protein